MRYLPGLGHGGLLPPQLTGTQREEVAPMKPKKNGKESREVERE